MSGTLSLFSDVSMTKSLKYPRTRDLHLVCRTWKRRGGGRVEHCPGPWPWPGSPGPRPVRSMTNYHLDQDPWDYCSINLFLTLYKSLNLQCNITVTRVQLCPRLGRRELSLPLIKLKLLIRGSLNLLSTERALGIEYLLSWSLSSQYFFSGWEL